MCGAHFGQVSTLTRGRIIRSGGGGRKQSKRYSSSHVDIKRRLSDGVSYDIYRPSLHRAEAVAGVVNNVAAFSSIATVKEKGPVNTHITEQRSSVYAVLASAFIVAVLLYPLDVIRALQMASVSSPTSTSAADGKILGTASVVSIVKAFVADHGVAGLFKQGLLPEVLRATWTRFLKFSLFPVMLAELGALPGALQSVPPTLLKVAASCLSAIPEAVCVMPIEAAKLALQLDKGNRHGNQMHRALISTFEENGAKAVFFTGFWAVLYRQASWTATYFASIAFLERTLTKLHALIQRSVSGPRDETNSPSSSSSSTAGKPSSVILLISGFIAGVLATLANTPGDTVRTVMQVRGLHEHSLTQSTIEVARDIIQRKGVAGLFSGFAVKSVILGLGGALMAVLVPFFDQLIKHFKGSNAV